MVEGHVVGMVGDVIGEVGHWGTMDDMVEVAVPVLFPEEGDVSASVLFHRFEGQMWWQPLFEQ